ncbi:sorbitol dehydrogenase [Candidatus Aerophobetes bacterium]|uniref:Sorbitol dehydrogenase n=1 Tax=Aerophobetes bacterium TaxID=2030807 RepID=A0A523S5X3_UNCAE|nr:MAG: sorbitol dehydrogenase [Candidatus Aerophobetes bacterium]
MKAIVKLAEGKIRLMDIPEPVPRPDQVKVKVKAAGICGTDIHGYSALRPPVVLGHEVAGEVVEVGERVRKVKIGDRVTSETTDYVCGKCRFCQSGDYNLCPSRRGLGSKVNGAFAEYFVIWEASIHKLPSNVDFTTGALSEPLACVTHAVMEQAKILANEVVLVLGPGPFGLLVTQVAKAQGATVVICGVSGDESRLALAKKFGANEAINLQNQDIDKLLKKLTNGYGADVVFECSGALPAVRLGLELVRKKGRYVQTGILHQSVSLDFDQILFDREITLIGSRTQKPSAWIKALKLMRQERVDLKSLVTDKLPLIQWEEGFRRTRERDSIKVLLYP